MREAPSTISFGENNDVCTILHRQTADRMPPTITGGGAGALISDEEIYVKNTADRSGPFSDGCQLIALRDYQGKE